MYTSRETGDWAKICSSVPRLNSHPALLVIVICTVPYRCEKDERSQKSVVMTTLISGIHVLVQN